MNEIFLISVLWSLLILMQHQILSTLSRGSWKKAAFFAFLNTLHFSFTYFLFSKSLALIKIFHQMHFFTSSTSYIDVHVQLKALKLVQVIHKNPLISLWNLFLQFLCQGISNSRGMIDSKACIEMTLNEWIWTSKTAFGKNVWVIAIHVRYLFDIFVSKGQFWLLGKNNNLHVQGTEFARYRWQTQNATILTELYVNRE